MVKQSMDLLELLRKRGMDGTWTFCGKHPDGMTGPAAAWRT